MALATKCPHCNTIFRVAHDQLKLRGGIVRCGACNEVFDGNAALVEPVAKPSPVMPSVPVAFAPVEPPHHLDPETIAGALAEEQLQDEAPAAPELLDAMSPPPTPETAGGLPVDDADESPLTGQDIIPGAESASRIGDDASPEVPAPADEESAAPGDADEPPLADAEAIAADDMRSPAPADAGSIAQAEGDAITLAESAPTDPAGDEAIAVTDEETGTSADADAIAATEADLVASAYEETGTPDDVAPVAATEPDPVVSAEAESAIAPDAEVIAEDLPSFTEPAPGAPSPDEQAASLDFIVDPDEFTDPLASPQAQDTTREHLVAAALDDAHHFDDLPAEDGAADAAPADEWQAAPADEVPAGETAITAPTASEEQEASTQQDEDANRSADEAAAADLIGAAPESASLAATGSAVAATAAVLAETADDSAAEEPGFVKRANRRQRLHRVSKAVMAFGSPILLAALVAQGVTTFRNPLAAAFPALKPTLNTLCEPLGCKVNLPMQIDMLAIEQGELQTLADNTFSFATVLRNQARSAQSWPSIELTLNDANDKPLVRRVFAPRDYLSSQADVDKGFAPRSEQSIKLYFELSQVKASGYHIAIFYP